MYRDSQGRFASLREKVESIAIGVMLLGIVAAGIYAGISSKNLQAVEANVYVASSTPAHQSATNRTDAVQALIDQLTAAREHDPSFIAETARQEAELEKQRHQAAVEDALMIIKTQYDVVLSTVTK